MSNKVIWITGASTGIGKAIAIKFSKNGWNVAISARRLELLEEISKQNQNINFQLGYLMQIWMDRNQWNLANLYNQLLMKQLRCDLSLNL